MSKILGIFLMGLIFLAPLDVQAKVRVFACEPEWAALAKEIGGESIKIKSATHAKQDPHHIRARPSLIAAIRRADLVICSGAGLEVGWLPILIQKAKSTVQPGTNGYLMAADFVPVLEKKDHVDRSMGDVHPEGNPHLHLNPHNISLVAKELVKRLEAIDSTEADTYRSHYDKFIKRWREAIKKWESETASLKGLEVVVHHKSFNYLFDWLGIKEVAQLEPKPGIPPTTSHLEKLLKNFKGKEDIIIIRSSYDAGKASNWLTDKTGIPAIVLPYTVGGDNDSKDLFALFNRSIALIKESYGR